MELNLNVEKIQDIKLSLQTNEGIETIVISTETAYHLIVQQERKNMYASIRGGVDINDHVPYGYLLDYDINDFYALIKPAVKGKVGVFKLIKDYQIDEIATAILTRVEEKNNAGFQ